VGGSMWLACSSLHQWRGMIEIDDAAEEQPLPQMVMMLMLMIKDGRRRCGSKRRKQSCC
jgi:hypothetical protein